MRLTVEAASRASPASAPRIVFLGGSFRRVCGIEVVDGAPHPHQKYSGGEGPPDQNRKLPTQVGEGEEATGQQTDRYARPKPSAVGQGVVVVEGWAVHRRHRRTAMVVG